MFFCCIVKIKDFYYTTKHILHKFAKANLADEQRRGMKSYLKCHKILIMPLLFCYRKN